MRSLSRLQPIRFGLLFGVVAALLTTLVMTLWDWLENPGGLFHGPGGTNWDIVTETAISWLGPVFLFAALAGCIGAATFSAIRRAENPGKKTGNSCDQESDSG